MTGLARMFNEGINRKRSGDENRHGLIFRCSPLSAQSIVQRKVSRRFGLLATTRRHWRVQTMCNEGRRNGERGTRSKRSSSKVFALLTFRTTVEQISTYSTTPPFNPQASELMAQR